MQPDKRPSIDGIQRPQPKPQIPSPQPEPRQPELRPDHELPAPKSQLFLDDQNDQPIHRRNWRKIIIIASAAVVALVVLLAISAFAWYQQQLSPASSDTAKHVRVTIPSGTAPNTIAKMLKDSGVIRSEFAFALYTKLSGTENNLKAGAYNLQPSLSTQAIVDHLVAGKQDTFRITFLPGDTLANNRKKIIELGYSEAETDAALNKTYNRPLFATKPASTDLEGYLYGETLEFDSSATVESILGKFFDLYEGVITDNNLVDGFKKQGLTLYQGITLASIVQREVPGAEDQKQVARVFLNRMKAGMGLGSDVTYQYAAKKLGVDPSPTLDSPYNTRIHVGLPPGPIATPGKSALIAVANPAANDYLFFLSGDDDMTYYAKTDAEHQKNIALHCQKKCLIN